MVGRKRDAERLLETIGSSPHSRQAVHGRPGIGKTTLVQYVKTLAAEHGYLAVADFCSAAHAGNTEAMYIRILTYIYGTIVASEPQTLVENQAVMQDVRQVILSFRTRTGGATLGIPGVLSAGGSAGVTSQNVTEAGSVNLPRLLRRLADFITQKMGRPGVVVHLNNLENLTEDDQDKAAAIFRDLWDAGLMYDGLHYLIVGTDEALNAIMRPPQLGPVISDRYIGPLPIAELDEMLLRRYDYLRLDEGAAVHPPVEPAAVHRIYDLFAGDLRETMNALNDAGVELIGLQGVPTAPMRIEDMQQVLRKRYTEQMRAKLSANVARYLEALGGVPADQILTKAYCAQLWRVSLNVAGNAVNSLEHEGYLGYLGHAETMGPGRRARLYQFTGRTKLILGGLLSEGWKPARSNTAGLA